MVSLQSLMLFAALAAPGQDGGAMLLDVSASWCGPCQQMKPVVHSLQREGYPVKIVDFDRHRSYAEQQLGVKRIPTFVLVKNNRVLARHEGPMSRQGLIEMMNRGGVKLPGMKSTPQLALPEKGHAPPPFDLTPIPTTPRSARDESQDTGYKGGGASPSSAQMGDACDPAQLAGLSATERRAMLATVRIHVSDASGESVATGTIIDTHGDEALILTCGHVFRDSKGKGRITIDFCAPGTRAATRGTLIIYDADKHDVGLISVRPGVKVTPVEVGTTAFKPQRGVSVFSIGCDRGADASIRRSRINSVNRYDGPANIQVAGQPVDGRSGGGLFDSTGKLVGICNAADPTDDEGIYAALPSIHTQLARIGQQRLYEIKTVNTPQTGKLETQPPGRPAPAAPRGDGVEVFIMVRPKGDPNAEPQQILLQNPSPEFLKQIKLEKQRQQSDAHAAASDGPLIRAQSE